MLFRCVGRCWRSLRVEKVNIIKSGINELPEVPLAPALRSPSPADLRQRTRLVHSVAVSLEQRASPLRSGRRSDHSISLSFCSVAEEASMPTGKPFERLPEAVRPQHYVLALVPDLKALVFDGDVAVQIEVGPRPPYADRCRPRFEVMCGCHSRGERCDTGRGGRSPREGETDWPTYTVLVRGSRNS
ncbi:Peptidase M1 domain containing protein [Asbolus verrucosus]|uniref:Peptidase M1 domain containing protein n=1 Tax=Asbolus verrucosus TaxID=1661398 RepID=A0A482VVR0_ASBVE|nr:Peptidase M1 domain containing protein [Asbolus verrucosus]